MIVVFDGNNRNGRICRIWGFGRKSTGGTTLKKTWALKKTCAEEGIWEEKGRRVSDRWIPSKFLERTRTIRSVEAAREINSSENRGSWFQSAKNTWQWKPRNRDMRFRDLIATVNQAGIWTVHLYGHVAARRAHRQFGVWDFEMSKSLINENPEIARREIAI